ncbi:MAG TPA: hypothetical protein VNB23_16190, partial [Ramlibacter sp.]|nr:hypothetical protein [Ramlibacter sp.]
MKAVKTWAFILALACLGGQARAAEVQFRAAVAAETAAAFARDDFKAIETRYAAALASGERSPAGAFTAGLIRSGVFDDPQGESAVPGRDDHWLPIERKLDQWAAQFPHSSLVAVLQSAAYIGHGWSWRGGGYARSVTPEGFKKVEEYTQRAYAALQARQKIGRKDPYWYVQMLHVARIQGWRGDRYGQLVQEATSAFPLNQDIYFAIGTSLQPRWGGSLQAIASFAAWAVEQTRQAEGEALYARIYWSVREPEALGGPDVDWGRIRAGFDEVVKRYPDSWNLNNYARMACEARDFATAKRVLLRIGEDVEPSAWLDRPTYIRCRTAAGVQESAATAGPKGNAPVPPPAATGA